jgi:hypothetical protein
MRLHSQSESQPAVGIANALVILSNRKGLFLDSAKWCVLVTTSGTRANTWPASQLAEKCCCARSWTLSRASRLRLARCTWPVFAWLASVNAGRTVPDQSGMPSQSVPDLTHIPEIKLNKRVSLPSKANTVAFEHRTIAVRVYTWRSRRSIILRSAPSFVLRGMHLHAGLSGRN